MPPMGPRGQLRIERLSVMHHQSGSEEIGDEGPY
jgi:hypothetical protein